MGFLEGVKSKLGEAKQGITDMNDRRKASSLVSDFASYPLCSGKYRCQLWALNALAARSLFDKLIGQYL